MSLTSQYTDEELYQYLGFSFTPSDRELEIKINTYIRNYSEVGNQPNPTLFSFFNEVYDRFFGTVTGGADDEGSHSLASHSLASHSLASHSLASHSLASHSLVEGFDSMTKGNPESNNPSAIDVSGGNTIGSIDSKSSLVVSAPYKRDVLNPILKQTIQRVVSIDSKYRNIMSAGSANSISTNFTIDLSEPLKDVLSIKLYSFQIPNTWYTVPKDYGSNFFILKGVSPGIDNGSFDYKISVIPGNYSPTDLVNSISAGFATLKKTVTDVSFGNTDISYNTYNSNATFSIDILNFFDQSQYYLDWNLVPDPARSSIVPGQPTVFYDIPSFLGYSKQEYSLSTLKSLTVPYPSTSDNLNNIYSVNSSNQSFLVERLNSSGVVDLSFSIVLGLAYGNYTRNQLNTALVASLQGCVQLSSNSSVTRINSTDLLSSYYELSIFLNRDQKVIPIAFGNSLQVVFPVETVGVGSFPIWTGNLSCFHFFDAPTTYLFNRVVSENNILPNDFPIYSSPTVSLVMNTANYVDASNNYRYVASTLSQNSYSLAQYIDGVNLPFSASVDPHYFSIIQKSPFLSNTSLPTLQFDFNLIFKTSDYYIDLLNTVFGYLFFDIRGVVDPSNYLYDLSLNPTLSGVLSTGNISIPVSLLDLLLVKPKFHRNGNLNGTNLPFQPSSMGHGLGSGVTFSVSFLSSAPIISGYYVYSSSQRNLLLSDIEKSFNSFRDIADYPLSSSSFTFGVPTSGGVPMSLSTSVLKIFSQNDFSVTLGVSNSTDISNTWVTNLGFLAKPYVLADYYIPGTTYAEISGVAKLTTSVLNLSSNFNYFYLRPIEFAKGLVTNVAGPYGSNYNDIRVEVLPGSYNTDSILVAINAALQSDSRLKGSSFTYNPPQPGVGVSQYSVLNIVVSKTFTAADYILDFYDTVSFVKCYVGDTSVRNTTWDTTIGWILGFRNNTQYSLASYTDLSSNVGHFVASITGDYSVNVNLYSYFLITMDDYNQCRLNDGLVSITKPDSSVPLPSYASITNTVCSTESIGGAVVSTGSSVANGNNLTLNQVYAINQVQAARSAPIPKSFSQGPFIKDIFGIIPLKTAGLQNGQVFSDYGGSLQQQERLYFGPVNIRRLQIQLYNNQGNIMDLNGSDWSFSFICEQLYQQTSV